MMTVMTVVMIEMTAVTIVAMIVKTVVITMIALIIVMIMAYTVDGINITNWYTDIKKHPSGAFLFGSEIYIEKNRYTSPHLYRIISI